MQFSDGDKVVVLGNGMVGLQFCRELVEKGLHETLAITVIGEESTPAYDRVKLSTFVDHRDPGLLILKPTSWYEENSILLKIGCRAEKIDREAKTVILANLEEIEYDVLILATGSRPFVPPIEGVNLANVFLYRSIQDLKAIITASEGKDSAAVIGGGLLGLEAAQAVQKLGLSAMVVERAQFLMPQQLSREAAGLLEKEIVSQDIRLFLAKGSTEISEAKGKLQLTFDGEESVETDLVIVSAGIVPNSEIAEEAGLRIGARGGVIVDDHLATDDDAIFAIGECALLGGRTYGLAAPGFAMARHLATRFSGAKVTSFQKPDISTRLKMLGVEVVTIGDALQEGRRYEYNDGSSYRMLLTSPRGKLIGGLGVGEWPEAGKMQTFFHEGAVLKKAELEYFQNEGVLSVSSGETPVAQLPDNRVICNCMNIKKGQLMACVAAGVNTPEALTKETGASSVCGSCSPLVAQICGVEVPRKRPVAVRSLLITSFVALAAVLVTVFAPAVSMAQSVESWWYKVDMFWRDSVTKQITGFSLMGIFLLGLTFSLRKRFKWFRFGHFARWRFFHAAFGLVALFALFFHTGFRFGHNLNFWLMLTFVLLNLLGAFAGVVTALESKGTTEMALKARRIKPVLTWAHIVLFWPLPVLLVFHILSVYLY